MSTVKPMKKEFIEIKEQVHLLNWLYTTIDLPKRVYEIHDMIRLFDKLDFSINDQETHMKITYIESLLKQSGEEISQTLKTIESKKNIK